MADEILCEAIDDNDTGDAWRLELAKTDPVVTPFEVYLVLEPCVGTRGLARGFSTREVADAVVGSRKGFVVAGPYRLAGQLGMFEARP